MENMYLHSLLWSISLNEICHQFVYTCAVENQWIPFYFSNNRINSVGPARCFRRNFVTSIVNGLQSGRVNSTKNALKILDINYQSRYDSQPVNGWTIFDNASKYRGKHTDKYVLHWHRSACSIFIFRQHTWSAWVQHSFFSTMIRLNTSRNQLPISVEAAAAQRG